MPHDHPGTLRLGITGHRPNKLMKAMMPRVERQLREVFAAIDNAASASGRGVMLTSGFAEGADQLAVIAAPAHWRVEAILPFPQDEYLKDFEQSAAGDGRDARDEFLSSLARASAVTELPLRQGEPRWHGYLEAGRGMLRASDVLIAVWDGEEANTGGTGQIVKEATDAGIPVVWLSTTAQQEPVLVERYEDGGPVASTKPWSGVLSA